MAVLSSVTFVFVWLANRQGVGWSYDSAEYVAVGSSLSRGMGLLDVIGKPSTVHPPGFSALIALGMWLGFGSATTILCINAVSSAITVVCSFVLLRAATLNPWTTLYGSIFVVVAPALMWQYSMAYSEPLFVAVEMLMTVVVLRMKSLWKYSLLTLLATALFLVRYVGPIFTAIILLVSLCLDLRIRGLLRALILNSLVVIASSFLTWLWILRNQGIDGSSLGFMQGGGGSYWKAFTMVPGTIGEWISGSPPKIELLSWSAHPTLPKVAMVCFLVVVIPLLSLTVVDRLKTDRKFSESQFWTLVMTSALVVGYVLFSVYRFVKVHRAGLDDRVMIPIFVPLVILLCILVQQALINRKFLRYVVASLALSLLVLQAGVTVKQSWVYGRDGRHLTSTDVRNWPLHVFVRSLPGGGQFFSNEMQTLFANTDIWPIGNPWMGDETQLVSCGDRYVVWYHYSVVTDNKPDSRSKILYEDALGTVFGIGPCGIDIDLYWN
ncbi:MAG: hypothetical protein RL478_63 [Actinomycetota bacterium]